MKKEDISAIAEQSRASISSQNGGNIGDAVKLAYIVGNFVRYVNNHKDKITSKDLQKALDNNRALRKVAKSVDKGLLVHFHELLKLVGENEHMASVYTAYEGLKKGLPEKRKVHRLSVLREDKNVVEEKVKGFVKSAAQRISGAESPISQGGGEGSKGTTSGQELLTSPPPPPPAPPPPKPGSPPKIPTALDNNTGSGVPSNKPSSTSESKGTTSGQELPMTNPNSTPPAPPPPPPPPPPPKEGPPPKAPTALDNNADSGMPSNRPPSPNKLEGANKTQGIEAIGPDVLSKLKKVDRSETTPKEAPKSSGGMNDQLQKLFRKMNIDPDKGTVKSSKPQNK